MQEKCIYGKLALFLRRVQGLVLLSSNLLCVIPIRRYQRQVILSKV